MKIIRTAALAGLVGLALLACGDNPVSEDRDTVFSLFLSPSFMNLAVNGEKAVTGYAVNRYGEQTFHNVTAQACDAKVTVRADSSLLPIEPPTRVIARGASAGSTCITFSGGGFTDTVRVVVQ